MKAMIAAAAGVTAVLLLSAGVGAAAASTPELPASRTAHATDPRPYPGNPEAEAKLVAAENARLIRIRALSDTATKLDVAQSGPYRLAVGTTPTLVLIARPSVYTIDELTSIAPRTVSKMSDGSYLVSENVVVQQGATLQIASKAGITVHLSSGSKGFVSVVANGGSLVVQGSTESPVKIDSWDTVTGKQDDLTSDGRAYIRVYGGRAQLINAEFTKLGFWSGLTGGVALTGTKLLDDPTAGGVDETGSSSGSTSSQGPKALSGDLLPANGGLTTLSVDGSTDDYGYATGLIQGVTFRGDAYGFFVSSSDRVEIRDSVIEDSLVDGLVLHRDVSNSNVESTIARNNAQNGFRLARATSSVTFQRLQAIGNGRDGISLEGGPLADGPSATGIPTTVYGNNEVTGSTSTGNGRYGIEVVGGTHIVIAGNTISGNVMGIVVSKATTGVSIKSNEVTDSQKQGIVIKDSALDASVVDNKVSNTAIGIYARNAGGNFEGNTIKSVSNHGISLLGSTGNSTIVDNKISGSGPSAIDVVRTTNSAVRGNDTSAWQSTKPLLVVLRSVLQPLTVLWIVIALAVIFSVLFVRRQSAIRDPFAGQAPLASFTRGIVERERIGSVPADAASADDHLVRENVEDRQLAGLRA
ncbi:MAG: right-handed parallel beta-helix repeat-containing protein [Pseudolysinimonas sp.]